MASATQKTQATEDLRRQRLESAIEDMLADYPYLIEEGLPRPKLQHWISDTDRVDLLFLSSRHQLIVEIKAHVCDEACVRQILRYLHILTPEHPQVRGILIGRRLNPAAARLLADHAHRLSFKALSADIPTSVLICADCRRAYGSRHNHCSHCGSKSVIIT